MWYVGSTVESQNIYVSGGMCACVFVNKKYTERVKHQERPAGHNSTQCEMCDDFIKISYGVLKLSYVVFGISKRYVFK